MSLKLKNYYILKNPLMNYAWGQTSKNSFILKIFDKTKLIKINNNANNIAEFWMGAHPKSPSFIINDKKELISLQLAINENPNHFLGSKLIKKKIFNLPFLFKILDIAKPLSIQAHPDSNLAIRLHKSDPKNYPDPFHKPEIAICLKNFRALLGFKPINEILNNINLNSSFAKICFNTENDNNNNNKNIIKKVIVIIYFLLLKFLIKNISDNEINETILHKDTYTRENSDTDLDTRRNANTRIDTDTRQKNISEIKTGKLQTRENSNTRRNSDTHKDTYTRQKKISEIKTGKLQTRENSNTRQNTDTHIDTKTRRKKISVENFYELLQNVLISKIINIIYNFISERFLKIIYQNIMTSNLDFIKIAVEENILNIKQKSKTKNLNSNSNSKSNSNSYSNSKSNSTIKEDKLFLELVKHYGKKDLGLFSPYIFNEINLENKEAVFLGPNIPHAYLNGVILECMSSSDNVVRGGLTEKYCDVKNLVKMLDYKQSKKPNIIIAKKNFHKSLFNGSENIFISENKIDIIKKINDEENFLFNDSLNYNVPVKDFTLNMYQEYHNYFLLNIDLPSILLILPLNKLLDNNNSKTKKANINKKNSLSNTKTKNKSYIEFIDSLNNKKETLVLDKAEVIFLPGDLEQRGIKVNLFLENLNVYRASCNY